MTLGVQSFTGSSKLSVIMSAELSCPRCRAAAPHCRVEHQGIEDGEVVWTVFSCAQCSFNWRDTEPDVSIRYENREPWLRMDPSEPERYRYNPPPVGEPTSSE